MRQSLFRLLMIIAFALLSCEPQDSWRPGGELAPGGVYVGADNVAVEASQRLEEPVPTSIEVVDPADIWELPDPLQARSPYYELRAESEHIAGPGGWFRVSFEAPQDANPEDLVIAFWMSTDHPYALHDELDGHAHDAEGHWEVVPAYVFEGFDGESRAHTDIFVMPEIPTIFLLAEGEYFEGHLDGLREGDDGMQRQELSSGNAVRVVCSRASYGDCNAPTRARFQAAMEAARAEYQELGFDDPRMRTFPPMSMPATSRAAVMYLEGIRDRYPLGVDHPHAPGRSRVCHYNENGVVEVVGRANWFTGKVRTCLWNEPRRAPQFAIHHVEDGARFTISCNGESWEEVAGPDDTPQSIAERFAITLSGSLKDANASFEHRVMALDHRVTTYSRRKGDFSSCEASATDGGELELIRYSQATDKTGYHEYFHALQFGVTLRKLYPLFYAEGTATAAQYSRQQVVRDLLRPRYPISTRLYSSERAYQGQDFFLYLARVFDSGIEWVQEIMYDLDFDAVVAAIQARGMDEEDVVWGFFRNQFEAFHPLDEEHTPCTTSVFNENKQFDTISVAGDEVTHSGTILPLSAAVLRLDVESTDQDQAYRISVNTSDNARAAIYTQRPSCEFHTGTQTFFTAGANQDSHRLYVMAGVPVQGEYQIVGGAVELVDGLGEFEVTVEPVDLAIQITNPTHHTTYSENRAHGALAEYVAEHLPAEIRWRLDGEVIDTRVVDERSGVVGTVFQACPVGTHPLTAEISDSEGIMQSHSVSLRVLETGPRLHILADRGHGSGGALWVEPTQLEGLTLTADVTRNLCEDPLVDYDSFQWTVPGAVNSTGQTLSFSYQDFEGPDSSLVPRIAYLSYQNRQASLQIRPCSSAGLQGLPTCPATFMADILPELFSYHPDLIGFREKVDLMMALNGLLDELFSGNPPPRRPWDDFFGDLTLTREVSGAIGLMHLAFNARTLEDFHAMINGAIATVDEAASAPLVHLSMAVDTAIAYYLAEEQGGLGGFFELSGLDEDFEYPDFEATLEVGRAVLEGALNTLAHENALVTDEASMAKAVEAGAIFGTMRAADTIDP